LEKIFIDSSIIIESFKGDSRGRNILSLLLKNLDQFEPKINSVVVSEVVYQLTFRKKFDIKEISEFITSFDILTIDEKVTLLALELIQKYNLKPNDALILSTCKYYKIKYLLSLDTDFEKPCEKEKIKLINSADKFI